MCLETKLYDKENPSCDEENEYAFNGILKETRSTHACRYAQNSFVELK